MDTDYHYSYTDVIGGQSYWLHHQYCYSTRTFMQELHKQILQLEKEEMNIRYDKRTNNHKYTLSYKIENAGFGEPKRQNNLCH